ncbi:MAG TPA: hypothetical protein VF764_02610 [Steroidobacteraceae bacterium]
MLASLATLSMACWAKTASAGTNESCSAAALRGTYVVQFEGHGTTSMPPQFSASAFFPITVIGTYTFGGNGVVHRDLTVSAAAVPPFPVAGPVAGTGSYQVAPDCSGTIEFPSNSETFTIYIVDEHRIEITATTDGRLGAGVLLKQEIDHCSNESLSGTFVFTVNGFAASELFGIDNGPTTSLDAYFPAAIVGNWYVDGSGVVTRSLVVDFGGSAFPYDDQGTYAIAPDCTGSAFFPNDDEPFKLIFVDSNTLVLAVVSTDAPGRHGIATLRRRER